MYILKIIITSNFNLLPGNTDYHDETGRSQGVDSFGSTLHFGPVYGYDPYEKAHGEMQVLFGYSRIHCLIMCINCIKMNKIFSVLHRKKQQQCNFI